MKEKYNIPLKKSDIKFAGDTEKEIKANELIYDLIMEIDTLQQENEELKAYKSNMDYDYLMIEKENECLKEKIDDAIEYMTSYESLCTIQCGSEDDNCNNNKNMDDETLIEMTRRYFIVHDKVLLILEGDK